MTSAEYSNDLNNVPTDGRIHFYQWGDADITGKGIKYGICMSVMFQARGLQIACGTIGGCAIRSKDSSSWSEWHLI